MQEHHETKWKDRKKGSRNHIDNDGDHRGPLAENIDYKRGSPVLDTISLGKAKIKQQKHLDMPKESKKGVDIGGNCAPDQLGEKPTNSLHNYKTW
eukprot:4995924-Heterocapsa_arctica.AAC.1